MICCLVFSEFSLSTEGNLPRDPLFLKSLEECLAFEKVQHIFVE
jgi:hypothetical protein